MLKNILINYIILAALFIPSQLPLFAQGIDTSGGINYKADPRVYTAIALWNAEGNNHEYRKSGMHPMRIEARALLNRTITPELRDRIEQLKKTDLNHYYKLGEFSLQTTGPPDFAKLNSSADDKTDWINSINKRAASILAELYNNCGIKELWEKQVSEIQKENNKFSLYARQTLENIISYCRLNHNYFKDNICSINFQFVPLLSYYTAFIIRTGNSLWVIVGPKESDTDRTALYHELLHEVVNPISATLVDMLAPLKDLYLTTNHKTKTVYTSWRDYINECFVRTLTVLIMKKYMPQNTYDAERAITNEYSLGFLFCPYLYREFQKQENSSLPIKTVFAEVIKALDVPGIKGDWEEKPQK